MKLLLQYKADVEATDLTGRTALHGRGTQYRIAYSERLQAQAIGSAWINRRERLVT